MKQTKETIKKEIKRLRKYIDSTRGDEDFISRRIAFVAEEVLRWSIEDTKDWEKPLEEVLSNSQILKIDIKEHGGGIL